MIIKQIDTIRKKKVLDVSRSGLIAVSGYRFFLYSFSNKKWERSGNVLDGVNVLLSSNALLRRLTRAEITKYYHLQNGTELCIARKGIFARVKGDITFKKVLKILRGSRPMNICENNDGCLYFGEYFANIEKQSVYIYKSCDSGMTWDVCYTFPDGNINHVHGIFKDPFTNKMWFATGDRDNECIIGYTEDGFKTVKEVFRGGQEFRTCVLFFYKDYIVYGTDSQYQENLLRCFDRKTLKITDLLNVEGPVIKGTQFGNIAMISTDVEPSDVNKTKDAYVWITSDGIHWEELCHARKDFLNPTLFQFGVFDLPQYSADYGGKKVYVSGKALRGCGGDTLVYEID